ncbi:MAG: heavy metal-binding domain-containing protein [Pseudomonadota bacterium]
MLLDVAIFAILFFICGLIFGRRNEKKHLASIAQREEQTRHIILDNRKRVYAPDDVELCTLVMGQYVSATDYFKSFVTSLRALVGGEMGAMITLMERARREAILRMVEQAQRHGATEIWNIRFETSNISQMKGKRGAAQVEIIAYGTAVRRRSAA